MGVRPRRRASSAQPSVRGRIPGRRQNDTLFFSTGKKVANVFLFALTALVASCPDVAWIWFVCVFFALAARDDSQQW